MTPSNRLIKLQLHRLGLVRPRSAAGLAGAAPPAAAALRVGTAATPAADSASADFDAVDASEAAAAEAEANEQFETC